MKILDNIVLDFLYRFCWLQHHKPMHSHPLRFECRWQNRHGNTHIDPKKCCIATANQSPTFVLDGNKVVPKTTHKGNSVQIATPVGDFDEFLLNIQLKKYLKNNQFAPSYTRTKKDHETVRLQKSQDGVIAIPSGNFDTIRLGLFMTTRHAPPVFGLPKSLIVCPPKSSKPTTAKPSQ